MSDNVNTPGVRASDVARPVEIISGAITIAKRFGVKVEEVREMERSGAPIGRRGATRVMVCEVAELWSWWRARLLAERPNPFPDDYGFRRKYHEFR